MSSSISSINSSSNSDSSIKKSYISDATKRQLQSLGIDPTTVSSESQAQSIINAKKAEKSFQDSLTTKTQATDKTTQKAESSESSLISEAKPLAEELGVSVSSDDTFDEITAAISDAIEKLMDKSANDPQALQQIQIYKTRLSQLNNQYSDVSTSNSNIYNAMSAQAANTRYMLGL